MKNVLLLLFEKCELKMQFDVVVPSTVNLRPGSASDVAVTSIRPHICAQSMANLEMGDDIKAYQQDSGIWLAISAHFLRKKSVYLRARLRTFFRALPSRNCSSARS